jgi:thiol-disulfide isomerase/thioredoxin
MGRTPRFSIPILVLSLSALVAGGVASADLPLGSPPPPFQGSASDWINSPPLTWQDLSGKVVLVDFMEYTCINCIRTFPYLKAWYERYKPYGFVIIGIHTPEFQFDSTRPNVAAAAKRFGLTYPILNDPDSVNWQLYNEQFWPSKYLFDQDSRLVEEHAGEGAYQQTERKIQELLRRDHPEAKFPEPLPPVRPGDDPMVMCRDDTPELYANPSRGFLGNLPSGWKTDQVTTFVDPGNHVDGQVYANGPFSTRYQSLQHARSTTDLQDYVVIRYHGTEVNVVVNRPQDRTYRVYATLDGKPVPQESKGDDLQYDARGSYFAVTSPRMYNVIRGPWGTHELKLASDSPDFDIYSYTFSGCPQTWAGTQRSPTGPRPMPKTTRQ